MWKNKERQGDWEFLSGITLLLYLTTLYLLAEILFIFKINICNKGLILAIAAMLICIIFLYFMSGQKLKKTFLAGVICTLLFVSVVVISGGYIDTSYDGNNYRKIMVGLLKEGWNPIWQAAETVNDQLAILPKELSYYGNKSLWFWMDAYPKSAAVVGAIIYDITNNIESGKYVTLLSMICVFCFYHYYLKKYLSVIPSLFVSLCLSLNPVSMTQMRSFYIDAFMGNIILIAIILIMLYFETESKAERYFALLLIDLCIIWIINIKFNGIFYIVCICFAMWIFLVYQDRKKKNFDESRGVFCFLFGGGLIAFAIGWSPYITNLYRYQAFLPGIFGDGKAIGSFTQSTAGMNPIEIFWAIVFSKMGDYWNTPELPLKLPFTISHEEISNYYIYAPQFGTFGMLFSGLFLVSMLLLLILLIWQRHKFQESKLKISFILWTVIFLHCMLSPVGIGGLRYVAHFYVIFVYPLVLGFYFCSRKKIRIILYTLCITAFVNITPYICIYEKGMAEKKESDVVLENIAPYANQLQIALSTEGFEGMLFNLRDKGIYLKDYDLVSSEELGEEFSYVCGWQIRYRIKSRLVMIYEK